MTDESQNVAAKGGPSLKKTAIIFSVSVLVIVSAIIATLLIVANDLKTSSEHLAVEQYLNENYSYLHSLASDYVDKNVSEFEDKDKVMELIQAKLESEKLSFALSSDLCDGNDHKYYTVYADGSEFLTLRLARDDKIFSGYDSWTVDEARISDSCSLSSGVAVELPVGSSLSVNSVSPDEKYLKEEKLPYHALSEFESELSESIYSVRYELGNFFFTPDIKALLGTEELALSEIENNTVYRFAYPSSMTKIKAITIPYGAVAKIGDIELGSKYMVRSGLKYSFLSRFEEKLTGLTTSVSYRISGLFGDPEIKVYFGGEELVCNENGEYRLPESATQSFTVRAPSDANVRVNGITLSKNEITREKIELPILDGVTNYVKNRPYLTEYTVSGLLKSPEITATDASGRTLILDPYNSTKDCLVFSVMSSDGPPEKDKVSLRSFTKYYITYLYSGNNNRYSNYKTITGMTPSKSLAYTKINAEYKGIASAPIHKNIKYGEFKYLDYTVYSSGSFSCKVVLPFTATLDGQTVSKEITIDILYVYSGNIRRVVNYVVY